MARTRRALLAALAAVGVAGCSSDRSGSPTPTTTSESATPLPTDSPTDSPTSTPEPGPERVELDDDRVRWKVEFPGDHTVEPAVGNGRLYVAGGSSVSPTPTAGGEATGHLTALSLPDGRIDWHRSLDDPPTSSVQVHGGGLYLTVGQSTGLHGVGQRLVRFGGDGEKQWTSPVRDTWLTVYGFDAERAYLGTGDDHLQAGNETTFAVDLETGTEQWAVEGGDAYGGRVAGETLYADYAGSVVASLATADGTERWRRTVEALHGHDQSFPTAAGHLFAAIERNDSYGIAGIAAGDGSTTWTHGLDASSPFVVTSATTVGETVVATEYGGLLFARDAATGEARWQQTFEGRVGAPLSSDGVLYCSVLDGPLVAVDADSGDELWRAGGDSGYLRLSRVGETLLAVGRGAGKTSVEAHRISDGGLRWRRTVPGELAGFVRAGATLAVATENQTVYGIALG